MIVEIILQLFLGGEAMQTCILCFSRAGENYLDGEIQHLTQGNTETLAKIIQTQTQWHFCKIDPLNPYPTDYQETKLMAKNEFELNLQIPYQPLDLDLNDYQRILLGYPNWWGSFPQVIKTFVSEQNLDGKTIHPFCTHEGSGFGRSICELKRLCPQSEIALELPVTGSRVQKALPAVKNWLAAMEN